MPFATRSRAAILSVALAAALPPLAPAQPVFFDDFSGPTLDPRWHFFGTPFDYTIAAGRLTVVRLNQRLPTHKGGYTAGAFGIDLPALADFRATVDLGWAQGSGRRMRVDLGAPGGLLNSRMYLSEPEFGEFGVFFSRGIGPVLSVPTPQPGPHRFTLARQGGLFRWLLDDVQVGQLPDPFGEPVVRLTIGFDGPWSGTPAPMWVDSVTVVPAPAGTACVGVCMAFVARRRR